MTSDPNWKKWFKNMLTVLVTVLIIQALIVIIIDPWFHFHAPTKGIAYILNNERCQNDGIMKHFDYDSIITGTSMCENFRASDADRLFGGNFVKVTFGGGYFKEIADAERTALTENPDLKMVIRSIDQNFAMEDKDYRNPDAPDPSYLYDNNIFNDCEYIFNREVIYTWVPRVLEKTIKEGKPDDFDDYMRFAEDRPLGAEHVMKDLDHPGQSPQSGKGLSDQEEQMLKDSIEQNFIANVKAHPDVDFYYFFPPFSGAYWYVYHVAPGEITKHIEMMKMIASMLTEYDNVHLFAFFEETDIVMDNDNYSDLIHYSGDISDRILEWMAEDFHRLMKEDVEDYFTNIEELYLGLDYDALYNY
ncbi:hypothetical protein [Butyrivibrio sp. MC2013]|uniref:hypothetical protein n=1 Tax=Butyrivibrio sp. MC2013 TaxID=1280686 RepID=UPI0003FA2C44|nr:hypothetical protein [Butyrivibrio sp. MC2013]